MICSNFSPHNESRCPMLFYEMTPFEGMIALLAAAS